GLAVAATPWMGTGWVHDYPALLAGYDRASLDPAFAWSITPELMSNLRSALSVDLGVADRVALATSNVVWLAATAAVCVAGSMRRLAPGRVWPLVILAYSLFCGHLSPTEDVALFCVLVGLDASPRPAALALTALIPAGLWLAPALGPTAGLRPS